MNPHAMGLGWLYNRRTVRRYENYGRTAVQQQFCFINFDEREPEGRRGWHVLFSANLTQPLKVPDDIAGDIKKMELWAAAIHRMGV